MPARSYEEAQAERQAEIFEIDAERVREALIRVAELFSKPGGEAYGPIYERLKWEWDAYEEAFERRSKAQAEAAELVSRLSSTARRGAARG
jgi:hypothetical protein